MTSNSIPLVMIVLGLAAGPRATPTGPGPCPEVAARVNGRPIAMKRVKLVAELILHRDAAVERSDAYRRAMSTLITREVLVQESETRSLAVEREAVESVEKESRDEFGDEKAWLAFLGAHGFDLESYRAELRLQATAQALLTCEAESVPVASDEEAAKFYYMYQTDGALPSAGDIETWRWRLTRTKRGMATRELVDGLLAKAKVEQYFQPDQCQP